QHQVRRRRPRPLIEDDDYLPGEQALDEQLGSNDLAPSEFSSQRRAQLDFSDLIPPGAKPGPASTRAQRTPLDFSDLIPNIPADQVPVPRPRPEQPAAPVAATDPMMGPGEVLRPAARPPAAPPPDRTAPTEGGFPAVQPPDNVTLGQRHGY